MTAENTGIRTRPARTAQASPSKSLLHMQQRFADHPSRPQPEFPKARERPRIVTLGVYGTTEADFFAALRTAGVDTFCDLRRRRGVRGSAYAFANRRRLQAKLVELGIRYLHLKELAPSPALRQRQKAADRAERTAKRERTGLSDLFVAGYHEECLGSFDSHRVLDQLGPQTRVVALFCVERAPAACHRSRVAERLHQDLGVEIVHLIVE